MFENQNMIRIRMKTNMNVVKVGIINKNFYIQYFQAHIMNDSKDFQTFELPLVNFIQTSDFFSRHVNQFSLKIQRLNIKNLVLVVESLVEKEFEIELQSIEIFKSNKIVETYENYNLPFFKLLNKSI